MSENSNGRDSLMKPGPEVIDDRRLRSRSRPNYSTRRSFERFRVDFPMTVTYETANRKETVQATAADVSVGGTSLRGIQFPADVERVTMNFRMPDGNMPEEFIHGTFELEGFVRYRDDAGKVYGIEFETTLMEGLARGIWRFLKWAAIVGFFVAVSIVLFLKYENLCVFWADVPIFFYSIAVGLYLVTRFIFAAFYKTWGPLKELPSLTVICAVFNEEAHIERTIRQVMESAYPVDKLNFVVVNDGSTDKTSEAIERVRKWYPEVKVVSYAASRGKREAIGAGLKEVTGDYVVLIDSDSFLDPNALERIVRPFADPKIGAVTGHCDVENVWTNSLTKMQAVRYFMAFRVMKAAESVFDSVTCVSGPLAAYRRSLMEEVIPEWLGQKWMGRPATFGDDRSLTNSLLKRNHRVVYQFEARATTVVPDRYGQFFNQQMRWKRSWFRESLRACAFMWKKQPLMSISFYLGFILPILSPAVVLRSLIYMPIMSHHSPLPYIAGVLLMSALLSTGYLFMKKSRLWLYGSLFCLFYTFALVWQLPWAILTFGWTKWGTRK